MADRLHRDAENDRTTLWGELGRLTGETPLEQAAEVARSLLHSMGARNIEKGRCAIDQYRAAISRIGGVVVLDDAWSRDVVDQLIVRSENVATIVTTREERHLPDCVAEKSRFQVEPMESFDAVEFFSGLDEERDVLVRLCELCGRIPFFLKLVRSHIKPDQPGWWANCREAVDELKRHGLDALTDADDRAAAIFEPSWERLSDLPSGIRDVESSLDEILEVLSKCPGASFGPGVITAWRGHDDKTAVRILNELASRSLLIRMPSEAGPRFRFHDLVREYASIRLRGRPIDALACLEPAWKSWEFVEAEFRAVGVFDLLQQYKRLGVEERRRNWNTTEDPLVCWEQFLSANSHILAGRPEFFFQCAVNEPKKSPVSCAAAARVALLESRAGGDDDGFADIPESWLECTNRESEFRLSAKRRQFDGRYISLSRDGQRLALLQESEIVVVGPRTGVEIQRLDAMDRTIPFVADDGVKKKSDAECVLFKCTSTDGLMILMGNIGANKCTSWTSRCRSMECLSHAFIVTVSCASGMSRAAFHASRRKRETRTHGRTTACTILIFRFRHPESGLPLVSTGGWSTSGASATGRLYLKSRATEWPASPSTPAGTDFSQRRTAERSRHGISIRTNLRCCGKTSTESLQSTAPRK